MRRAATAAGIQPPAVPLPPGQVVEQTVTTKTTGPATATPQLALPAMQDEPRETINEYFQKLDPEHRAAHIACYLYRLDSNIVDTSAEIPERNKKYAWKFTREEMDSFCRGPFLDELRDWVKKEFGGGVYQLNINDTKLRRMAYAPVIKIDGPPRLSSRDAGAQPQGGLASDQSTVRLLIDFIDKKLDSVKTGGADPGAAVSQVTQVLMDSQSKMFAWMLEHQPKAADPMSQLTTLREMLTVAKELMPAQAASATPKTTTEQFQEMVMMMELMDKIRGNRTEQNPANLKDIIVAAVKEVAIPRARGNDWNPLIELVGKLAPALTPIGMALAEKIKAGGSGQAGGAQGGIRIVARNGAPVTQPAAAGGAAGGPMPTGARPVGGAGTGMPGGPVGQPAPAAAPPPAPAQTSDQGERVIDAETVNAIVQHTISTRLVDMLTHNRDGADAAASIDDMFPEVAARLKFATIEMLQTMVNQDSILITVKDDPRLPAFLEGFYAYFHPVSEPGDDEDSVKVQ